MPKSRINDRLEYTHERWVVSVLNTTRSLLEGHSAIVVEGLEDNRPHFAEYKEFIGQYDISTIAPQQNNPNKKGFITKIKCFGSDEEKENERDYVAEQYPAQSYYVTPIQAKRMLASIKEDAVRTANAMENWARIARNERRSMGELEGEDEPLILEASGDPITPLKYQKLGKNHFLVKIFGNSEEGDNCAGWCLAKLAIAEIGDGKGMPKPKVAAGQCGLM